MSEQIDETFDLELPGKDKRRFDPRDCHRLTIRGDRPEAWAQTVELDGRRLLCSKVEISMDATGLVKATITLPTVILDMDTNAITPIVGAFALKEHV